MLIDKSTGVVSMRFPEGTCEQVEYIKKHEPKSNKALFYRNKACEPIKPNIYCPKEGYTNVKHHITGKPLVKWNVWNNALLFVLVVVILHLLTYGICILVHKLKTCGDGPEVDEEDEDEKQQTPRA